jgi:hypothetical protein
MTENIKYIIPGGVVLKKNFTLEMQGTGKRAMKGRPDKPGWHPSCIFKW